jgi:hypothetical protein
MKNSARRKCSARIRKIMKVYFLILTMLLLTPISFAQSDWKTKNFDKWDAKDVDTILNKSEWVKNQEIRLSAAAAKVAVAGSVTPKVSAAGGTGVSEGASISDLNTVNQGKIQPPTDFTFTLRLRSSMAIRLALIRQEQLEAAAKELSSAELELYHKRQKGLYECPACAENYVVTVTSRSKENKNYDAIYAAFGGAKLEDLKRYIYLQNEKGEKRELVHFTQPKAPGSEAVFFFRRLNEKGEPLFTKDSKLLILNLTNNQVNLAFNFKMEIPPIVVGDKVDF